MRRHSPLPLLAPARWIMIALLCACDPSAFDDFVGKQSQKDAGRDAGMDAATPPHHHAPDGGSAHDGATRALDASMDAGGVTTDAHGGFDAGFFADDEDAGAPPAGCAHADDPSSIRLEVEEIGALPVPDTVPSRALITSAAVGERVVWVFSVPGDQSMAAWSSVQDVLSATPKLDDADKFVPLLPAAAAPNGEVVSPTAIISANNHQALIFYAQYVYLTTVSIGLARIERDANQADIVRPLTLFTPAQANPNQQTAWTPFFGTGPVIERTDDGDFLYLYACQANPNNLDETAPGILEAPCRVARVVPDWVAERDSYRYWDGSDWVEDPLQAKVVIKGVTAGLSVSFNHYLGKYVAVHSGTADNVILRWADRPEGPWHSLGHFDTLSGAAGALGITLGGIEHPALRDACQQALYISYHRDIDATDDAGAAIKRTETHLVRVRMQ